MENGKPAPAREARGATSSRRRALALMFGASGWLPAVPATADVGAPLRLAISESVVGEVNLNDARAAMQVWMKRMAQDMNLVVEYNPKVFETTQEILGRARRGLLDAVALNVIEYRQMADLLDSSQVIASAGEEGPEQYAILVRQNSGIQRLGDLRGRRLILLEAPRMCMAAAWLSAILDEGHFGPSAQFLGPDHGPQSVASGVAGLFWTGGCLSHLKAGLRNHVRAESASCQRPEIARHLPTDGGHVLRIPQELPECSSGEINKGLIGSAEQRGRPAVRHPLPIRGGRCQRCRLPGACPGDTRCGGSRPRPARLGRPKGIRDEADRRTTNSALLARSCRDRPGGHGPSPGAARRCGQGPNLTFALRGHPFG